jgi:hypothetical protein
MSTNTRTITSNTQRKRRQANLRTINLRKFAPLAYCQRGRMGKINLMMMKFFTGLRKRKLLLLGRTMTEAIG